MFHKIPKWWFLLHLLIWHCMTIFQFKINTYISELHMTKIFKFNQKHNIEFFILHNIYQDFLSIQMVILCNMYKEINQWFQDFYIHN